MCIDHKYSQPVHHSKALDPYFDFKLLTHSKRGLLVQKWGAIDNLKNENSVN